MLIIITGKKGIGKTVVCRKVVDLASQNIGTCGGVFTYKLPGGSMVIEDILTMKQMVLAGSPNLYKGPQINNYSYNPEAIKFRLSAIEKARDFPLLMVDEIGPLEMKSDIEASALPLIGEQGNQARIMAVDENLLPDLLPVLGKPDNIFPVTFSNRNSLPDQIVASIMPKPG